MNVGLICRLSIDVTCGAEPVAPGWESSRSRESNRKESRSKESRSKESRSREGRWRIRTTLKSAPDIVSSGKDSAQPARRRQ